MAYLFGQSFTYSFYPVQEEEYVPLTGVTDAPAIHVYSQNHKPSRGEAIAGTDNGGLLQTITTWAAGTDCKNITIAAISDPDPTSGIEEYTYWIAINFALQASGEKQTIVRALPMQRVSAHHKAATPAAADLEAVFSKVDTYATSTEQTAAISTALTAVQSDLEANRFKWAEIWRPDKLKDAVVYKALYFLMLNEIQNSGDKWERLAAAYGNTAKTILDGLRLETISTPDTDPAKTPETKVNSGFLRFIR